MAMKETKMWFKRMEKRLLIQEKGGSGYFSRDQVNNLQSMLDLEDHETASMCAEVISAVLDGCHWYIVARDRVPHDEDAKDRLREIAKHAEKLADLLSKEPTAWSLFPPPKRLGEGRGASLSEIRDIARRPKELQMNLRTLAELAKHQANDRSEFARIRELLPRGNSGNPVDVIAARILWPQLFAIMADVGKQPAYTLKGPTYRFLSLVHDVGGLPSPRLGFLRGEINAWKTTAGGSNEQTAKGGK